ncbi:hypothetical protein CCO03_02985 [Comamonas serinivorans]|uniref:Uncharacterized protein n=1 Tax=Comamonas serinivorans TaxID=1082851 RepID=A0A1Y0EJF5_9BURK|nr:hypothetical protein CCO03_02985 [Comamonas serinivorans]
MEKEPLYRKVNTTARGVFHRFGADFSTTRRSVNAGEMELDAISMKKGVRRGLDYTPLFRFLLSRVGKNWDEVYSEAVARLDRNDPIFWMVALREADAQEYFRSGEASYFSGLKVDEAGVLRVVNPSVGPGSLVPQCPCCTHTFNGIKFTRPYDESLRPQRSATRLA